MMVSRIFYVVEECVVRLGVDLISWEGFLVLVIFVSIFFLVVLFCKGLYRDSIYNFFNKKEFFLCFCKNNILFRSIEFNF